jgi:hypothetical protein
MTTMSNRQTGDPAQAVGTGFRIEPLDPYRLAAILATGSDDSGNPPAYLLATEAGGTPLRCCLREAEPGERVALLGWRLDLPAGPYAEIGPVYVHADGCPGYQDPQRYPAGFARRVQVQRGYDSRGWMVEARLVQPDQAESSLAELLSRPGIAVVHSRNPLQGCYMFAARHGTGTGSPTHAGSGGEDQPNVAAGGGGDSVA